MKTTLGQAVKKVPAVLLIESKELLPQLLVIANELGVSVYPVSTGKNWGFGSASPVVDNCVILDLSQMNKILSFDKELGVITVEPGVTFEQLTSYLHDNQFDFIAPVTGAGGSVSVLGNLLEKGRSDGGYVDRSSTLLGIEAVLADGSLYSSQSSYEMNFYKWGSGPYLDGIFLQSNYGVVTSVSITLSPKPEQVLGFCVYIPNLNPAVIEAVKNSITDIGSHIPSIKLINRNRLLINYSIYYEDEDKEIFHKDKKITSLLQGNESEWVILGYLSGNFKNISLGKKFIKEYFKNSSSDIFFFDRKVLRKLTAIDKVFPFYKKMDHNVYLLRFFSNFLRTAVGEQISDPTMPVWKKMVSLSHVERKKNLRKDYKFLYQDDCGFIFFHAVIPLKAPLVLEFIAQAEVICIKYNIDFVINFVNLSRICFKISIPIIFDKSKEVEVVAAETCYKELENLIVKSGGYVDRKTIYSMDTQKAPSLHNELALRIKKSIDPNGIISPGRYVG